MKIVSFALLCDGRLDQSASTAKDALREYRDLEAICGNASVKCVRVEGHQAMQIIDEIEDHMRDFGIFGRKAINRLSLRFPGCEIKLVGPIALLNEIREGD